MNTSTVARPVQSASPAREYARDRVFYSGMAVAMGLTVFVGFGPSYYLRFLSSGPGTTVSGGPFTPLVHLHGVLFTAWVLLFIVQTALVASRRIAVHRRLGVATAVLAVLMIVVGTSTAIATASRGVAPPGVDPLVFLAIPLFDMLLFATFITFALIKRRDREAHKRLMLLAYASIIVAAVARLPGVLPLGPLAFFALAFLFILIGGVYDFVSRGRVHRVYVWGGALFAISVPVRLMISGTGAWRQFAQLVTS